jgi:hypothetical protein
MRFKELWFALCGLVNAANNDGMALARRVAVFAGVLAAGAALVVLGVIFVTVGLNKASEISGIIGAVVGVAGLGLSAWGIVLARRAPQTGSGGQAVSGTIHGDNIQIGQARDVHLRD